MASKNVPDLKNDNFYKAALLLVESELGKDFDTAVCEETLGTLEDSLYKETNDLLTVVNALKGKLTNPNRR